MIENVYRCEAGRFIHCFAATQRYVFFASSSLIDTHNVDLYYLNYDKSNVPVKSGYPIKVSSASITDGGATYVIKSFQIVSVPLLKKNAPVEVTFFLVINTGDGIQVCPLDAIVSNGQKAKVYKWTHGKPQDFINTSHSQGYKDGSVVTTFCTMCGSIIQLKFDISTMSFQELLASKPIMDCRERIMDRVNNISGLRRSAMTRSISSEESLWSKLSSREGMVLSCFDNSFYAIVDNKLEVQTYYDSKDEEGCRETVVLWADFAIVKQYSASSLRFYVINVSNIGCILYKRSNRAQWDVMRSFPRKQDRPETTALIDCLIVLDPANSNQVSIFCGSENGKLYEWVYDFRDDTVMKANIIDVADSGVIHSLTSVESQKLFFLGKDNTSINYLLLP